MAGGAPVTDEAEAWRRRFIAYLEQNWNTDDGSHDIHHLHRVWRTGLQIDALEGEKADHRVLVAATYFHDYVSVPKNDPARGQASLLSADRAVAILRDKFAGFPPGLLPEIHHAIHAHSFSAAVPVKTVEAAILQDADRMEALGAIGLARMFYTAGKMSSELFDAGDPLATHRDLDDRNFSLDHLEVKLLKLPSTMQTAAGRQMAAARADFLRQYRDVLLGEIGS